MLQTLEEQKFLQSDISIITKTKLDHLNYDVQHIFDLQTNKAFGRDQFCAKLGSSSIRAATPQKFGGTATIVIGNTRRQIISIGKDPWGRWMYVQQNIGQSRPLTIITAYQPCKPTFKTGQTAFHQQEALA